VSERERDARPERAFIVVTHHQRLLNYIVPDFVHV
jgi:Fe-S cluster assembly ATPase SufC